MPSKSAHYKAKPHGGKTRLMREFYAFVNALPEEHRKNAETLLERARGYDPNIDLGQTEETEA
jgi:hypothetical protein